MVIYDQMNKIMCICLVVFISLSFLYVISPVPAEENLKDIMKKRFQEGKDKDTCTVIKEAIGDGLNVKEVTQTSIELGCDVCLVIKCAIEAKGNLEQISIGAVSAGVTTDVFSRCAIDAGADVQQLAKILGYIGPPAADVLTPGELGLPGGEQAGGGVLSPSSF